MTNRGKTLAFVLGATLANVLSSVLLFLLLLALYAATLGRILAPEAVAWAVMVCFLLALTGTAFLYRFAIGKIRRRWNLDEVLGAPKKRY
ncbi:MAG: hypothetical protein WAZ99_01415 [Rectinemataceae bacterium]